MNTLNCDNPEHCNIVKTQLRVIQAEKLEKEHWKRRAMEAEQTLIDLMRIR